MALLKKETRKKYLEYLGFDDIASFQKAAFKRKEDRTGKYNKNTDNALRTWRNVKKYTTNFQPKEFICECNGRYCCGYPTYMKRDILKAIQKIRNHWGVPIAITCGMRCDGYNRELSGSIANSEHKDGGAVDWYQKGVTDTLANRKKAMPYIRKIKGIKFAYGDGIEISGGYRSAPFMGNAMHINI